MEDVYCRVYLKSKDMDSSPTLSIDSLAHRVKTSISEYTKEPKWIDEKHVFNVRPNSNTLNQEDPFVHLKATCSLRVVVRAKVKVVPSLKSRLSTKVGLDSYLGQV